METRGDAKDRRTIADGKSQGAVANGFHKPIPNEMRERIYSIITGELRNRIEETKQDILEHVNDRLNDMMSEIVQKVETVKPLANGGIDKYDKYIDKIKSSTDVLPSKQLVERNSLLTDLFEVKHIRTIYNIFIVILICLFINTAIHDIMHKGSPNVGINTIIHCFGKLSTVFYIWSLMKLSTFCVYVALNFWRQQREEFAPKSVLRKVWDYGCLIALIFYQVMFVIWPTKAVIKENLPIASSTIVLMEQVRLLMKTHAFVRSVVPRFLSYKPHSDKATPKMPGFSQYLYFLFAPTLIYQDNYPRTKQIRWKVVAYHFSEVAMTIFYIAFLFERFIYPGFQQYGTDEMDRKTLIMNMLEMTMPSTLFLLCGFYCLLHSWQNGCAELLRFADRLFYKDWWNSTSYGGYYRTWNVVVHDWLFTYIYKDIYENVTAHNKVLSTCAVFLVSALFHEYILAFVFRFFYPVMLVMFGGFGLVLVFLKRAGNIFMWLSLCIGTSLMVSFYTMEMTARHNCPAHSDEFLDLFIPRSWSCFPGR